MQAFVSDRSASNGVRNAEVGESRCLRPVSAGPTPGLAIQMRDSRPSCPLTGRQDSASGRMASANSRTLVGIRRYRCGMRNLAFVVAAVMPIVLVWFWLWALDRHTRRGRSGYRLKSSGPTFPNRLSRCVRGVLRRGRAG